MIIIRLKKCKKKKTLHYTVVVADRKAPRDGKFIEKIGYFNIQKKNKECLIINKNCLNNWIKKGAQVTKRIKTLIKKFK